MRLQPHAFSLRQLQYAVAVADELSFRRAAERCHVSQPSLSAQLAELEQALGVKLFERDRRRVLVTSAGQALLERARRVLLEADDLVELGKRAADPLTGKLRLGVIPTIAPYLLPAVAPKLHRKFPSLNLLWREDRTDALCRALQNGELDAALLALEADLGDVEHELIGKDPFFVAMRKDHALAEKSSPLAPAELQDEQVLLLDDGHCFRDQALEVCGAARASESDFRATSLTTLVQMVAGGSGITLLPELALATEAKRARLHVRALASPRAQRTIALVWRKRSALAPALRELASALRSAYPPA
jgi:LysR family hydrogen peroxide-inducible transcriptional activator